MPPARKRGSPLESSSSTDQPLFRVGRLGRPHGLDGYLGLYVDETELSHFQAGSTVLIGGAPYRIRAIRRADRGHQVAFEEVTDRNTAESIRNLDVFVTVRRELGVDEFWPEDLVGLEVRPGGGTVAGVEFGFGQDRLVIERAGSRFEVPFVESLVPVVDVAGGFVELIEIEGLSPQPDR